MQHQQFVQNLCVIARKIAASVFIVAALAAGLLIAGASAQINMSVSGPLLDEYPLVKIPIQLRDDGSVINSLSLSYFTIDENGTQRQPLYLDCATDTLWQSLSFLYVLDVSESMGYEFATISPDPELKKWNAALQAFNIAIDAMRPGDGGLLYTLWRYPELIVPFTTDKDALRAGLVGLDFGEGTLIYDTILKVLNEAAGIGGRRVMILLTDGKDYRSFNSKEAAVGLAQQMGVPIYIIGLDVKPELNDTLRYISEATGGEYNYAPTPEQLQVVMFNIAENILTKDCILAYETDDTCRDGVVRNIEVTATVEPTQVQAWTNYSLPYEPQFIDVVLGEPQLSVEDDNPLAIPLNVSGPLRKDRFLKIFTEIEFDPNVVAFDGIDSSGAMASLTNVTLSPHPTNPGTIIFGCNRITLHEDVAVDEQKTLFSFRFSALHQDTTVHSVVDLQKLSMSQHCPITPVAQSIPFTVIGCPQMDIGIDTTIVAFGGTDFIVPLRLLSPSEYIGSPFEYTLTVQYDPAFISYQRFLRAGTISEHLDVMVTEIQPGELRITALMGDPETQASDFLRLVFDAHPTRDVTRVALFIQNASVVHSCAPVVNMAGSSILLDGDCNKLVRRRDFFLGQNAPNPVRRGTETAIPFTAGDDAPVTLQVFDIDGKPIATLVQSMVEKGEHAVQFRPGDLPPAVYFYTLSQGDNVWTRKLVVSE